MTSDIEIKKPRRILIFGASGMVGQGVLRECLADPEVVEVKVVVRKSIAVKNPKLKQLVTADIEHLENFSPELSHYDACFFSLGASVAGLNEEQYKKINYDIPIAVGNLLVKLNPDLTFIYVSGMSTDSTGKGSVMWARVKGQTENDLMKLPFKGAYMFRLAALLPKNGELSKTSWYRYIYAATKPIHGLFQKFFPDYVITTEELGRAALNAAKKGHGFHILQNKEIRQLGISGEIP